MTADKLTICEELRHSGWLSLNTGDESDAPWRAADCIEALVKALSELRDWAQATAPHGVCGKPLACITCGFIENADAALTKVRATSNSAGGRG